MSVRTRFAPSPTGELHLGGARTALFNWLFAKGHKGKFLLRIEDTDAKRSDDQTTKNIIKDLKWLNLNWDEDIVYQKENIDKHKEVINNLLRSGHAYNCYCSEEEIKELKSANETNSLKALRSPWRDIDKSESDTGHSVIRFKTPENVTLTFNDKIRGLLNWKSDRIEDFVIARSDGTPTYNLAVVADDKDMKISHVIRGEDHITNTIKQTLIYEALNWNLPVFAHIPLIQNQAGQKLSKRDGKNNLVDFKRDGILPMAMMNYLARLGWSYNNEEFFSDKQAISWFSLKGIGKSPSKYDEKKLLNLCGKHLKALKSEELYENFLSYLKNYKNFNIDEKYKKELKLLTALLQDRCNSLGDIYEKSKFLFSFPEDSIFKEHHEVLSNETILVIESFIDSLNREKILWNAESIEKFIKRFCEQNKLTFRQIGIPLRILITGSAHSASITDILEIIGKENTIYRLKTLIQKKK